MCELDNFDSRECLRWHRLDDKDDDLGKIIFWTWVWIGFKTGEGVSVIGNKPSDKVKVEPGDRSEYLTGSDDDVDKSDFGNNFGTRVELGILFESYVPSGLDVEAGVIRGVFKSLGEFDKTLNNRFIKVWL